MVMLINRGGRINRKKSHFSQANGSAYDCVRANKTEAELVVLSPEETARPIVKCANGKRLHEIWVSFAQNN